MGQTTGQTMSFLPECSPHPGIDLCGRASLTKFCLPNEANVPAPTSRSPRRDRMPRSPSPIFGFNWNFP